AFIKLVRPADEPIADRPYADPLRCGQYGVHIEPIMSVKLADRTRLAKVLDAERPDAMPHHAAKPRQCFGMGIANRDDGGIARQSGEQLLHVRASAAVAMLPRPLSAVPAGRQPVRRGDG